MTRLPYLTALATLLFLAAQVRAEEPKVAQNVLLKPTFLLANGSWSGGSAFLLRGSDRPQTLLVTCHHLFGPATGLDKQMTCEDIAKDVCGAVGLSMQDRKTIIVAQTYLKVAGARPFDDTGAEKDLAVFVVPEGEKLPALELAEGMPKVGDAVYVFARLRSETEPKLLPATVSETADKWLSYTFKDKSIDLRGTSGAPVLDDKGHVVGMNLGGGEQNGQLIGVANPATSIRAAISAGGK
jgi:hypothetical protein